MAAFQKFHSFVEALAEKKHDLGSDTLKVYLTNSTPNPSTNSVKADLPEIISSGNGYTPGGNVCSITSSTQTAGTYKLVLADPATWLISSFNCGPFRYAVLYNDTAANDELIGYWDYGTSFTLIPGESFKVDFDPTSGVLTLA